MPRIPKSMFDTRIYDRQSSLDRSVHSDKQWWRVNDLEASQKEDSKT